MSREIFAYIWRIFNSLGRPVTGVGLTLQVCSRLLMARRPTPNRLKELAGNPGHRPLNAQEPMPKMKAPEMPKGMSTAAKREWKFIVPILLRLGIVTEIDGKALAAYCDSYALWEEARRDFRKHGLILEAPVLDSENKPIYVNSGGVPCESEGDGERSILMVRKANPSVAIYERMAKLMKSFLIEFGLTPASRSKLKIDTAEKPDEDSALENLLANRPTGGVPEEIKKSALLQFKSGTKESAADSTNFDA